MTHVARQIRVRPMLHAELSVAASLTLKEKWHSETLEEFEGFHQHDPEGCLIAERQGEVVGIGVATLYQTVGFLGEIIVLPEFRGQGVGGQLVQSLLQHLERHGARTVFLDGTREGIPLYERHGFQKRQPSLRYTGHPTFNPHPEVRPMTEADLDRVLELDRAWWGADRSFFLQRRLKLHPGLCVVLERAGEVQGYLLGRQRGDRLWVGPWGAALHIEDPAGMLTSLAAVQNVQSVHAGLLSGNTRGHQLLLELGFRVADNPPWRMVHGTDRELGNRMEVLANGTSAKG